MDYFIDIETRSDRDIKTCGSSFYAASDRAEILIGCIGYKTEHGFCCTIYRHDQPSTLDTFIKVLQHIADEKHTLWAHNVYFEYAFINKILPKIAQKINWGCTMGMAIVHGLPSKLEQLSSALGVGSKIEAGKDYINKYCIVDKKTNQFQEVQPEDWEGFIDYCVQDAKLCSEVLPFFDKATIDYEIGYRTFLLACKTCELGVPIDLDWCSLASDVRHKISEKLRRYYKNFNPNSPAQIKQVLEAEGITCGSLGVAKMKQLLQDNNMPSYLKKILKARQALSLSSLAKYDKMLDLQVAGRVRGGFIACGAYTGRDTARLFQPQNFPSGGVIDKDKFRQKVACLDEKLDQDHDIDIDYIFDVYDDLKSGLRQSITTKHMFFCGDYSKIEYCLMRWFVDGSYYPETYDIYIKFASEFYGKDYADITKKERAVGKTAVLSLMYGMGHKSLQARLKAIKIDMSEDGCKEIIRVFRYASYPKVKKAWRRIEQGFRRVLYDKSVVVDVGGEVSLYYDEPVDSSDIRFVKASLPSGRSLNYLEPYIFVDEDTTHYYKTSIHVKRYKNSSEIEEKTWGGTLFQNIIQALARDILLYHCYLAEKFGFSVVMRVHDELVVEVEDADESKFETFNRMLQTPPPWLNNFVLKVESWRGREYHK